VAAVSPCGAGRPVVANAGELEHATRVATGQLNRRAGPWVWGRPPPPARKLRRKFVYRL
jgi:hypothetical protein